MREDALEFTPSAVKLLEGYARVGYTFQAVYPVVRRAEEIARERHATRIGRGHIILALDQISRQDDEQHRKAGGDA